MMKVEQAGEKLHAILNNIERRLEKIKNKAQRYWCLLREYENFIMCDLSGFAPQKRGRYKPRKNKSKAKKVTFSWKKQSKFEEKKYELIITFMFVFVYLNTLIAENSLPKMY